MIAHCGRPPASRRRAKGELPAVKNLLAFLRLPAATRALALEAAFALVLAKLLVGYVPMRFWRRSLDTAPDSAPAPPDREGAPPSGNAGCGGAGGGARAQQGRRVPQRVGRVVGKVARRLPFSAPCLPQAMAAQWLLRRRGIPSRLAFGARRADSPDGPLQFHAWLMAAGECVVGAHEIETYAPFPPPAARDPRPG